MLSIIYDSSEGKRKEKKTDRDCLMTEGVWLATHNLASIASFTYFETHLNIYI